MCNPAIDGIRVERGRGWCVSVGRCCRLIGWISIGEHERLLGLRDLGHRGLREEAAALQLPFLLLLQQLAAHQPGDRGVIGEDANHVGALLGS